MCVGVVGLHNPSSPSFSEADPNRAGAEGAATIPVESKGLQFYLKATAPVSTLAQAFATIVHMR
jgi:hypothetical protein